MFKWSRNRHFVEQVERVPYELLSLRTCQRKLFLFQHQSNQYLLTSRFPVSAEASLAPVVFAAPASLDPTSLELTAAAPANKIILPLAFYAKNSQAQMC